LEVESYLGGMTTDNLKKGHMKGYGLYATSRRVLGVQRRKGVFAGKFVGGLFGSAGSMKNLIVSSAVGHALTKDEGVKEIEDLEKHKDFEIRKDDISLIEIKKPGTFKWGHVKIKPKSGKDVTIDMNGQKEYEYMKVLMNAFLPEAVHLEE
jgi:hypothetical protein